MGGFVSGSYSADCPETPKVIVVSPCYGNCTIGYAQSFFGASVKRRGLVNVVGGIQPNSSLLPTAFNECLARALTMRDSGKATHMAMLHTDISAGTGWLDTLWSEMWDHEAAFISAVVPIKAEGGRTSTAIGAKGNRWKVRRCLYLADVAKLPTTFGAEAVCKDGEVLLVNTGCWLTDLRHPFWDYFIHHGEGSQSGFNLHSRVIRAKTLDGTEEYTVETRSEDWELSHDMDAFGMRYVATSAVKLTHEGGGRWNNF